MQLDGMKGACVVCMRAGGSRMTRTGTLVVLDGSAPTSHPEIDRSSQLRLFGNISLLFDDDDDNNNTIKIEGVSNRAPLPHACTPAL
jgi:hypothetical protein